MVEGILKSMLKTFLDTVLSGNLIVFKRTIPIAAFQVSCHIELVHCMIIDNFVALGRHIMSNC